MPGVPLGLVQVTVASITGTPDPSVRARPLRTAKEVTSLPLATQGPRAGPTVRLPLQVTATVRVPITTAHPATDVPPVAVPRLVEQVDGPYPARRPVAAPT